MEDPRSGLRHAAKGLEGSAVHPRTGNGFKQSHRFMRCPSPLPGAVRLQPRAPLRLQGDRAAGGKRRSSVAGASAREATHPQEPRSGGTACGRRRDLARGIVTARPRPGEAWRRRVSVRAAHRARSRSDAAQTLKMQMFFWNRSIRVVLSRCRTSDVPAHHAATIDFLAVQPVFLMNDPTTGRSADDRWPIISVIATLSEIFLLNRSVVAPGDEGWPIFAMGGTVGIEQVLSCDGFSYF